MLFVLLILTFFFQKPTWCDNRGDKISKDCNIDSDGNIYYVSQLLSLPRFVSDFSNILTWFIMAFLILPNLVMVYFGDSSYKLRVTSMILCLVGNIAFHFLTRWFNFFIFRYEIAPFFRIGFMILYSNSLRNSMKRLFFTISGAKEAILVFVLNLVIWSSFAFIIFSGKVPPVLWDLFSRRNELPRRGQLLQL